MFILNMLCIDVVTHIDTSGLPYTYVTFKIHFIHLAFYVSSVLPHICSLAEPMMCSQTNRWTAKDLVWHRLVLVQPAQHIALSACHSASTTLAESLLFRVKITFSPCARNVQKLTRWRWCRDISQGFVVTLTDTHDTGMAGPPGERKGTAEDMLSYALWLFLILFFLFLCHRPRLQPHTPHAAASFEKLL